MVTNLNHFHEAIIFFAQNRSNFNGDDSNKMKMIQINCFQAVNNVCSVEIDEIARKPEIVNEQNVSASKIHLTYLPKKINQGRNYDIHMARL